MATIDKGRPDEWAELNPEETRCLMGLANYYKTFENKNDEYSRELAWADLQKEHPRLTDFLWFQS